MNWLKRSNDPVVRVAVLGALFLVLVAVGVSIALREPTPEDLVEDDVRAMIRAFERQEAETFLGSVRDPLRIEIDGQVDVQDAERQRARFARVHRMFSPIGIKPGDFTIKFSEVDTTVEVSFPFKYSLGDSPYRGDGKLPHVDLVLEKINDRWIICEVDLKLP